MCLHVRMCTCVYACVRVSKHVCVHSLRMCTSTYACVRVPTHVYMYLHMSTCIYEYVRVPTHVYVYLRYVRVSTWIFVDNSLSPEPGFCFHFVCLSFWDALCGILCG